VIIGETPLPDGALGVDAVAMTMRFGDFVALDDVELKVRPGSFHALLGENGAGKSTLVKCIMGYYHPTEGDVLVGGREQAIANPKDAHALGLGMVYQHFTLVPAMTVAENLVLARDDVPTVVDWAKEKKELEAVLDSGVFAVSSNAARLLRRLWLLLLLAEATEALHQHLHIVARACDVRAVRVAVAVSVGHLGGLAPVAELGGIVGRLTVIDAFQAGAAEIVDHCLRTAFLHLLGNQSDLPAVIALVAVAIDVGAVEQFADLLDVLFRPFIRQEARQCADAAKARPEDVARCREAGELRPRLGIANTDLRSIGGIALGLVARIERIAKIHYGSMAFQA